MCNSVTRYAVLGNQYRVLCVARVTTLWRGIYNERASVRQTRPCLARTQPRKERAASIRCGNRRCEKLIVVRRRKENSNARYTGRKYLNHECHQPPRWMFGPSQPCAYCWGTQGEALVSLYLLVQSILFVLCTGSRVQDMDMGLNKPNNDVISILRWVRLARLSS